MLVEGLDWGLPVLGNDQLLELGRSGVSRSWSWPVACRAPSMGIHWLLRFRV